MGKIPIHKFENILPFDLEYFFFHLDNLYQCLSLSFDKTKDMLYKHCLRESVVTVGVPVTNQLFDNKMQ